MKERYHQLKELFQAALERTPAERTAFLVAACQADQTLRAEVNELLAANEQTSYIDAAALLQEALDDATLPLSSTADSMVGQQLGPYRILREIGHGGMGSVYLAERDDKQFKKQVAVKLLRVGSSMQAQHSELIVRRFRQERQILASLEHPNIARLLDGGATPAGLPYLVLEYVEGQPLDEYCDGQQLSLRERLQLFRTVCSAVHYAHQNLVVHRDLKPSNILITQAGTPKLLDFGIAKILNPESFDQTIDQTLPSVRLMTPAYASPEQVRGEAITTASDVYALGVVLYELLTGHRPYQLAVHSLHETARVICETEPPKPSAIVTRAEVITGSDGRERATITPAEVGRARQEAPERLCRQLAGDLDNIVLMALRKEPQRRYASVEQFSEDIQRHFDGLPVRASRDTFAYRSAKFMRRNRAGVAAAALVTLSLIAGIITTAWQARVARAERVKAEQRFNDVRKLAHTVVFELHDAIETLPGSTPARALLVQRSIEYLDSLAREAASDVALQRELATAYERIGDLQGNPYRANLGNGQGALQSYRQALALREAVLQKNPRDAAAQLDLADSLLKLCGAVEYAEGADAALKLGQRALGLCNGALQTQPASERGRQLLASSHETVGNALRANKNFDGALANYGKSLSGFEALFQTATAPADKARYQRNLAINLRKYGDVEWMRGQQQAGLALALRALEQFTALAQAEPNNAQAQFALSAQHTSLGNYYWEAKDLPQAEAHYRQGLQLDELCVRNDPNNVQMRRSLIVNSQNVGYTLAQQGHVAQAQPYCDKALTELAALLKTNATAPGLLNMAKEIYGYDGEVNVLCAERRGVTRAESQRYWQAALKSYQRSLDLLQQLKEKGLVRQVDAQQEASLQSEIAKCKSQLER
ncbi:MAG: protein kinase [Acidobacteria bacterium]|nr:protein kinase [Acidobacteriota bacterium]MBI3425198.1 protein kinase [Acidobacteriota bacterium]